MKLIGRMLVSFLFLVSLITFTAFYQEETLASVETCPGINDVDIDVEGTGKNKEQARDDLADKIESEVNSICSGSCSAGTCEATSIRKTPVNCKYSRRNRLWFCRTTIKSVECGCVDGEM